MSAPTPAPAPVTRTGGADRAFFSRPTVIASFKSLRDKLEAELTKEAPGGKAEWTGLKEAELAQLAASFYQLQEDMLGVKAPRVSPPLVRIPAKLLKTVSVTSALYVALKTIFVFRASRGLPLFNTSFSLTAENKVTLLRNIQHKLVDAGLLRFPVIGFAENLDANAVLELSATVESLQGWLFITIITSDNLP